MQEDEQNVRLDIIPNSLTRIIDLALDETEQFVGSFSSDVIKSEDEKQKAENIFGDEQDQEKKDFSIIMLSQPILPINIRKFRLYQASVAV